MSTGFYVTMAIIALVFGVFPMARFLYSNVYPYLKDSFSQDAVLENGIVANANIVETFQTSSWTGNKPIYKLTLRFNTETGQVIESSLLKALTFKEIENYKEGNQVTIKYDPEKPEKIAIQEKPIILG
ncbi:TPA: DUF3592 domain-containing protein [Klebsiella aerogenes]|uniref:DUF3592 domain-containing protein n=1 Tax=Klebsiella TaxID=570 RepID=UPI00063C348F|nr:DUF3592 domain-containing protein [Klebsiella aerogenes]HAG7088225.1 DUF3592 domain-containing protein [Escherichia coli]EKL0981589.1 DUF3592 domain-containing protein [Klebsiella aerogenes]EKW1125345.1 DUF3592 domain-containing protein [Klebsiella aerogenes]EKW1130062.1 DUF3592 domain-containing protein [Klebsiella aerogenes]EKZ9847486.1 DUF3592 domain-containing protein [Klebsiella aerogenes]